MSGFFLKTFNCVISESDLPYIHRARRAKPSEPINQDGVLKGSCSTLLLGISSVCSAARWHPATRVTLHWPIITWQRDHVFDHHHGQHGCQEPQVECIYLLKHTFEVLSLYERIFFSCDVIFEGNVLFAALHYLITLQSSWVLHIKHKKRRCFVRN